MKYVKPTERQIAAGMEEGWPREACERGYDIFNYDGLGLLEVEAIADVYLSCDDDEGYDDEACAREAERTGFCKIIPIKDIPEDFMVNGDYARWFGWVDTPENRKAIEEYYRSTKEDANE